MNIPKEHFGKKDKQVKSYTGFWTWFQRNEKDFFTIVKNRADIEKAFFDKLSPKLEEIKDGFFFLTGMHDDNTAELVLTADGSIKNIVFVEELVAAAPKIDNWKFTALKPSLPVEDIIIEMGGYQFHEKNISFYSNELPDHPDEIDIVIVHNDLTEKNKIQISNGTYIFLDNYLGELDFLTNIDNVTITGKKEVKQDLIPISKLKDFLAWRQKEFVEKYEGIRYNTLNDSYSIFEAKDESGNLLIATINTAILKWDSKSSHPWVSLLTLQYTDRNNNGMPNSHDFKLLNNIEEEILQELKVADGYLLIGRQTVNGKRDIYFACNDFRKPSKIFFKVQQNYSDSFEIGYDIYKDKYWQSFERFND